MMTKKPPGRRKHLLCSIAAPRSERNRELASQGLRTCQIRLSTGFPLRSSAADFAQAAGRGGIPDAARAWRATNGFAALSERAERSIVIRLQRTISASNNKQTQRFCKITYKWAHANRKLLEMLFGIIGCRFYLSESFPRASQTNKSSLLNFLF